MRSVLCTMQFSHASKMSLIVLPMVRMVCTLIRDWAIETEGCEFTQSASLGSFSFSIVIRFKCRTFVFLRSRECRWFSANRHQGKSGGALSTKRWPTFSQHLTVFCRKSSPFSRKCPPFLCSASPSCHWSSVYAAEGLVFRFFSSRFLRGGAYLGLAGACFSGFAARAWFNSCLLFAFSVLVFFHSACVCLAGVVQGCRHLLRFVGVLGFSSYDFALGRKKTLPHRRADSGGLFLWTCPSGKRGTRSGFCTWRRRTKSCSQCYLSFFSWPNRMV